MNIFGRIAMVTENLFEKMFDALLEIRDLLKEKL